MYKKIETIRFRCLYILFIYIIYFKSAFQKNKNKQQTFQKCSF